MTTRQATENRRGATTVEGAIVLSVLLFLLFVTLDLGIAVCRYGALAKTAKHVARQAIVRGAAASPTTQPWGPAPYAATAADNSAMAVAAARTLPTMSTAGVSLQITWLDGNNREGDRVQVQVSYVHQPLIPFLQLNGPWTLRAASTMSIVH